MKKASFTVECALLMPIILYVIIGLLYLDFHIHNQCWFTAAAYESAIDGSLAAVRRNQDGLREAEEKAQNLENIDLLGEINTNYEVSGDKQKVQVEFTSSTIAVWGGFHWDLEAKAESRIIKPVVFIRKYRALGMD
ncbi:MAG: pilus assembly protein [Lachnospiraceae bacterium]|jgi:hypothetical protein|nr:pilus assembly protein [Lachnospiraceae bacterium]MDD3614821.1 pilus assembly protein [Lachnospiraceae bacterium]